MVWEEAHRLDAADVFQALDVENIRTELSTAACGK